MFFRVIYYGIIALIYCLWVVSCANIIAPTGGPKDERPPQLDTLNSTPNEQTNFQKQPIILTFDEWLKLQDEFSQIVVTPPLEFQPKVSLKRRSVVFRFDEREVLKEDATYIINYGTAVRDLNESNIVPNLRFVFATGDYIDSLEVNGKLVDAFSGDPVEDVLLMLYDNLADSVVRTERPFYFARTDKQGFYQISNVKSDTFKVFALKDANLNYLYDNQKEIIGFPDSVMMVADTLPNSLNMKVFAEEQVLRVQAKELNNYGLIRVIFNRDPEDNFQFDYQDVGQNALIEDQKDTLKLWYDLSTAQSWQAYLKVDTMEVDTLKIKGLDKKKFAKGEKLGLLKGIRANSTQTLHPLKACELEFNHPIAQVDTSKIRWYEDTTRLQVYPNVALDSLNRRLLQFRYAWKEGKNYAMVIDSSALLDWFALTNDTLKIDYKANSLEDYGDILVKLVQLEAGQPYVMQLLFNESELIDEVSLTADSTYQKRYNKLTPGNYIVRVIEDRNSNGRWDSGNYDEKRQSERLMRRKLEELRANWELEAEVIVGPAMQ
ncbi:MAG: Ig-like domain-containing protein [Bacteroidota bacterium]